MGGYIQQPGRQNQASLPAWNVKASTNKLKLQSVTLV